MCVCVLAYVCLSQAGTRAGGQGAQGGREPRGALVLVHVALAEVVLDLPPHRAAKRGGAHACNAGQKVRFTGESRPMGGTNLVVLCHY